MSQSVKAFVFDAYGTLFDVRAVLAGCETLFPGYGDKLTTLWRTKQLEYSWLRSLMGRYQDFWQLTEDSLRYCCQFYGLDAQPHQVQQLLDIYMTLAAFPGITEMLQALQGRPVAILSNGTPAMLEAAVQNAGIADLLTAVLSVEEVQVYKPHPLVYALATSRLGLAKEEIVFVSSNAWDVAGAKAFGFQVYWLNRGGYPVEVLGVQPDGIISSPAQILELGL